MITIVRGDLLKQSDVGAIVNTVNCVGVMGKGIALQFKNKWPGNYQRYVSACKEGVVRPGRMLVYDAGGLVKPNYIINFPTKDHWRGQSTIGFIRDGLVDLIDQVKRLNIRSIAIPPLGCGNGGLDWNKVRPLIEAAFVPLPEVEVRLFEPKSTPDPRTMDIRTKRPHMTPGRAAILKVLETYRSLNYGLSRLEVQKLAYFLQEAGEPLRLNFVKAEYGPYADNLRHALNNMEGHFIQGVGDGVVESDIQPIGDATAEAAVFLMSHDQGDLAERVARVERLIDGYQSPYGMELLATVHWVATRSPHARTLDDAIVAVVAWNDRKKTLMQPGHLAAAWQRLSAEGWIDEAQEQRDTRQEIANAYH